MDRLLTPLELSALVALALRTIYNRRATGGDLPPAIVIGGRLRFKTADVEHWLEKHKENRNKHAGTKASEGGQA